MQATMRAMVLREFARPMEMEDVPMPQPGHGDVLVRVRATGVCGTDVKIARGRNRNVALPRILGHEMAGEVAALGPGASGFREGDRVAVHYYIPCGRCEYCRSGQDNFCQQFRGRIGFDRDGGYAEYVVAPLGNLFPLPGSVSFGQASILSDAVATCWEAVKSRARLLPGQVAVVVGLGGLGLHAVQVARAAGAVVIAVDSVPAKLEMARKMGASHTVDSSRGDFAAEVKAITGKSGADAVLELRGRPETVEPSVRCLKAGGRLVMLAYYEAGKLLATEQRPIVISGLTITGSRGSSRQSLAEVIRMVEAGLLRPLVAETRPLANLNEALESLSTGSIAGRMVVET